ncbi:hypothetical protein [Nocardia shimofusensis]|uniref:hypothetical protein n=1 Tax=Nocardia shimofusensis TaxID=228596 RepID=UPI000833607A|nr:hypothetical protein [Nocardia shimofusensis]
MTDSAQAQLRTWQNFKEQGINGEFKLENDIGEALVKRCNVLLGNLQDLRTDAALLSRLSGYGGLPSADALRKKFEQKATGGAPHDPNDNAIARIDQHIEIVTTMRDAYLAAIGKLVQVDQETGQTLTSQGDQLN